jgi:hypothetical protein
VCIAERSQGEVDRGVRGAAGAPHRLHRKAALPWSERTGGHPAAAQRGLIDRRDQRAADARRDQARIASVVLAAMTRAVATPLLASARRCSSQWVDRDDKGGSHLASNADSILTVDFRPAPPLPRALGEVVIVDDRDGDGTFQIDEHGTIAPPAAGGSTADAARDRYVAGTQQVLIYVARPFPPGTAAGFPVAPGTARGYSLLTYVCEGRVVTRVISSSAVEMEVQTGTDLVERRTCMRTHSP